MLEEKIERLTSEVIKLREAIQKGGSASAGAGTAAEKGKPAADKPKGKPAAKSKFTPDQVKTAVIKVKDDVSQEEAQRIIKEVGKSAGLAELISKVDVFDEVMIACEAALLPDEDENEDGEDDGLGGL